MRHTPEQILDLINAEEVLRELIDNYVDTRTKRFPQWASIEGCVESYSFNMGRGMVEVQLHFTWAYGGESDTYCEFPLAHLSLSEEERIAVWQAEEDARLAVVAEKEAVKRAKTEAEERKQLADLLAKHGAPGIVVPPTREGR